MGHEDRPNVGEEEALLSTETAPAFDGNLPYPWDRLDLRPRTRDDVKRTALQRWGRCEKARQGPDGGLDICRPSLRKIQTDRSTVPGVVGGRIIYSMSRVVSRMGAVLFGLWS